MERAPLSLRFSMTQYLNDSIVLLNVLHDQKRAVIVAGGLDSPRHHFGKSFTQVGELRDQRLASSRMFLQAVGGVRYIGGLVLHNHVEIVAHCQRKDFGEMT